MNFTKTIGHEKQKQLLGEASERGKLSHAYAFSGEAGIGKTTLALELAELLGADSIMDVALFDGPESLSVEEARHLQTHLALSPVGKYKIAIIASAENMNASSANSLLKILEEPPARALIFLTVANFHKLLPTLISRVQRLNFAKSSTIEVRLALATFALEEARLQKILGLSGGRIGFARRLASDSALYDFFAEAQSAYQTLEHGLLLERLKKSEALAGLETNQIREFLVFAMNLWTASGTKKTIGDKLLAAYRDLEFNVNIKLALDNLFL